MGWPCMNQAAQQRAAPDGRDRQNSDYALPIQVGNVVRKACERMSSGRNLTRPTANKMTNLRPLTDFGEHTVKGLDKLDAKSGNDAPRTTVPPLRVRPKPRVPSGTPASGLIQTIQDSCSDIRPRLAGGLAVHHAPSACLNLGCPRRVNFGRVIGGGSKLLPLNAIGAVFESLAMCVVARRAERLDLRRGVLGGGPVAACGALRNGVHERHGFFRPTLRIGH